jgi:hypothetical protein
MSFFKYKIVKLPTSLPACFIHLRVPSIRGFQVFDHSRLLRRQPNQNQGRGYHESTIDRNVKEQEKLSNSQNQRRT